MLSGALLLDPARNENHLDFLRRLLKRIGVPLIVWSVIYYCFSKFITNSSFSLLEFLSGLINGNIYFHLAFLYYLIGLYILYPILRSFLRGANENDVRYFLVVWLATLTISSFSNYFDIAISGSLMIMFGFIGYPVAGWYISTLKPTNRTLVLAMVTFAIMWLATFALTWHQKTLPGAFSEFFYEYLSPNVVIAAFALFYVLRFISWENLLGVFPQSIIEMISATSFSVYFIHPLVMLLLGSYLFPASLSNRAITGIPLYFLTTTIVSTLFIWLLNSLRARVKLSFPVRAVESQ
jgi:surface polysaccharide O-acyltransferase-like enzyme